MPRPFSRALGVAAHLAGIEVLDQAVKLLRSADIITAAEAQDLVQRVHAKWEKQLAKDLRL